MPERITNGKPAAVVATLDVGTSRVKGALFERESGSQAAAAEAPSAPLWIVGEKADQDPALMMQAIAHVLRCLADQVPTSAWAALSVTTQRGTLMPLDACGEPLTPVISWLDRRGSGQAMTRWDWIKQHQPKVENSVARVGSLMSWVVAELTGEVLDTAQTAPPEAASSGLGAPVVGIGSQLRVKDLNRSKAGRRENLAAFTLASVGLPTGLPVVIAGGDKNAELVGAGGVTAGVGGVSFGTAVSLGRLTASQPNQGEVFATPAHVPGFQQLEVGLPFGGGVWAWAKNLLGVSAASLADLDIGVTAPLFLPYLRGSLSDSRAKGAWFGLDASASSRSLLASVMEGILFDLRRACSVFSDPFKCLHVYGGGTSPLGAQWLADMTEVPVRTLASTEAGLVGAAVTAAVSLGWAASWQEACAAYVAPAGPECLPREGMRRVFDERFSRWLKLVQLSGLF